MNKLIEELANKAAVYANARVGNRIEWINLYTERLAQLIVRECTEVAEDMGYEHYDFYNDKTSRNACFSVRNSIKELFE